MGSNLRLKLVLDSLQELWSLDGVDLVDHFLKLRLSMILDKAADSNVNPQNIQMAA